MIHCSFLHQNRIIDLKHLTETELKQVQISTTISWWKFTGFKKREKKTKAFLSNFKYLPGGFWWKVLQLSKKKYDVRFSNFDTFQRQITPEEVTDWLETVPFKNNYYPYWYQIKALFLAIKYPTSRASLATGSGKTFVMYLLSRYLLEKELQQGKKVLIIVPSIMLVEQTAKDFEQEYPADDYITCDRVYGGSKRNKDANVVIANIDSAIQRDSDFFEDFGAVIYDEAHKLSTAGYQQIFEFLIPNEIIQTYALSGSFHEENTVEDWTAESISGPVLIHVGTKDLIEGGQLTPVEIICCKLKHNDLATRAGYYNDKMVRNQDRRYGGELAYIRTIRSRFDFITRVAAGIGFNQLLLFKAVAYCKSYVKYLKETYPEKNVLLVVGEVSAEERERIKLFTENNLNVIICATYGTMSTGISIKNLGALHFVEAPKTFIWVRQSIGRLLRLHPEKDKAICFDYSDHISIPSVEYLEHEPTFYKTISSKHLNDRIKIYKEQGFPYEFKDINL